MRLTFVVSRPKTMGKISSRSLPLILVEEIVIGGPDSSVCYAVIYVGVLATLAREIPFFGSVAIS